MTDFHESRDYTVNNDTAHHAYYDYHVHTGLDENHTVKCFTLYSPFHCR